MYNYLLHSSRFPLTLWIKDSHYFWVWPTKCYSSLIRIERRLKPQCWNLVLWLFHSHPALSPPFTFYPTVLINNVELMNSSRTSASIAPQFVSRRLLRSLTFPLSSAFGPSCCCIIWNLISPCVPLVCVGLLPAADNAGPVDERGPRGGRTQTLHRTPARLQRPQEDRYLLRNTHLVPSSPNHEHTLLFLPSTHTHVSAGDFWIYWKCTFLIPNSSCVCRHHADDGILSGGDPGLTGEPEVQWCDGCIPATGL